MKYLKKYLLAGFAGMAMALGVNSSYAAEDIVDALPLAGLADVDWTGFFVSASVGQSKGSLSADDPVHLPSADRYDLKDTVFGGQAGYRYQFDNDFVLGASFSAALGTLNGEAFSNTTAGQSYEVDVDSAYLVNFMAGLAIGKWLPYAAYGIGRAKTTARVMNVGGVAGVTQSTRATHDLKAVTFGVKYAIWDNLSIGGALQRVDVSEESYAVPLNACCGNRFGFTTNGIHFVIDYRF